MATVTKDDCVEIVKNYLNSSDFKLLNYNINPIGDQKIGYLGEHFQIKIIFNHKNSIKNICVFGKTPPLPNNAFGIYSLESRSSLKEELAYNGLLKELTAITSELNEGKIWAPKCYLASNSLLVLEDLSLKGYVLRSKHSPWDYNHTVIAFKALAKMHASSIIFEERKSKELGKAWRLYDSYEATIRECMYRNEENFIGKRFFNSAHNALESVIEILPESYVSISDFKNKICEIHDKIYENVKRSQKFRNVVVHGDLWTNNALFKYDNDSPVDCILVDFQFVRYLPPAHDIMCSLYLTTSPSFRKKHFDDVLEIYHHSFSEEISKVGLDINEILPYSQLEASCTSLRQMAKYQAAFYHQIIFLNGEDFKKCAEIPQGIHYVYVDRSEIILKAYTKDPVYKARIIETMSELRLEAQEKKGICIEDCNSILKRYLNSSEFELIDYCVSDLPAEKTGFLGENLKIKIAYKYDNNFGEAYTFAKRMPKEPGMVEYVTSTGCFRKESDFYTHLYRKFIKQISSNDVSWCPKPFIVRNEDLIVVEDISVKGFRTLDENEDFNYDHVVLVLKSLAKMHASSIIYEEKTSKIKGCSYKLTDTYPEMFKESLLPDNNNDVKKIMGSCVKALINAIDLLPEYDHFDTSEVKRKIPEMLPTISERFKPSQKYRNVVSHGDLWENNLMFRFDNEKPVECVLVDFQMMRYNPPAHDVLCFLHHNLSREFRKEHLSNLLIDYHTFLSDEISNSYLDIENILPMNVFLESCKTYAVTAKLFASIAIPIIKMGKEFKAKFLADNERMNYLFYVDRTQIILENCKNDLYKKKIQDMLLDLVEMCPDFS